jgi:adenylate kinase family enzyme
MIKIGKRIVVVGTSGSGKTTLARQLADCHGYPHIELDSLHWGPNWTESPDFLAEIEEKTKQPCWVIDGNYSRTSTIFWPRADTIIWLDYPITVCYWRVARRTFQRVFLQEELWNGNRERFRAQFLSKESLFFYIYQTHKSRRQKYSQLMHNNKFPHLTWIRHQSPRATHHWLKQIYCEQK